MCTLLLQNGALWDMALVHHEICGTGLYPSCLTHWGRVTHICVSKLSIIGSDNGLSPDRRQAIIWTNAGILLIGPLGTNFSEISIEILTFSFKKIRLKVSSAKRRPFCLGLNVLMVNVWSHMCMGNLNLLHAKLLRENINIYLHFMSFLHTNKTHVVEIPPRVRQGPAYST